MIRTANAQWQGSGKEGTGNLSTQSGILNHTQYSFLSRFEQGIGTNPEELVAAAHAGCFSMKLSFVLGEAGFKPELLETQCRIKFENGSIVSSHLVLNAKVEGIGEEVFAECVHNAEKNCPISKLLNTAISVEYSLNK
ncbi:MAG: OsmC family protein [Saprospiraceae bacterium]|nr:OsmC family protein [Candidatus Vicinibacter affinis]MBP6174022.1 OsmC family protein [Saprospiraceae bacterium]MBK6823099.1 OsmC family protein [Candidatus Vicinibacter affinis]MBK7304687.1 OsmC family protein [Candidatus Vicinibacter affinis]MBK7696622.1 OsmC family protein [Candidatus Vicinibacter affinis]